ncbi:probable RNA-directed DNA polymerase from transposon BS [Trichonephila clavipes]|nr:probable RNA-directed DNA polymerase from transposon BS [Trichonephila clavipes]
MGLKILDSKGDQLEDLADDLNLTILNTEENTYVSKTNGTASALDISAINALQIMLTGKFLMPLLAITFQFSLTSRLFRSPPRKKSDSGISAKRTGTNHCAEDVFTSDFTIEELEYTIRRLNPKKYPGPDVTYGHMIVHFGEIAKKYLLNIFITYWRSGKLPKIWKSSAIIPILKPGKDAISCKSYRPILTCVLCKLMQRIVHSRLIKFLTEHNFLHFYQTAYTADHNTVDQLFYLSQTIMNGFQEKPHEKTVAVFLDLSSAFDPVWRQKLVNIIHSSGIKGSRPRTLKNAYSSIIRPVLEYAAPIWAPASISSKQKLDSIQHRASKIIIGVVSSTNNEKAEKECGLPPLECRRNLATVKVTNKLRCYKEDHISTRVFNEWTYTKRLKRSSKLQLDEDIRIQIDLEHSIFNFMQEPPFPRKRQKLLLIS